MPPEPSTAALSTGLVVRPALPHRVKLGPFHNPVRMLTNAAAAVAFAFGAVSLWQQTGFETGLRLSVTVFTGSLIGLFLVSATFHSMPWNRTWMKRVQRLDHSMIYLVISGTYTPILYVGLDGPARAAALAIVWSITAVGVTQKMVFPRVRKRWSVILQTIQGWLMAWLVVPMADRLSWETIQLIALGGLFYMLGMGCFVSQRPRLWHRVFSYHELFHLCVITAASLHYAAIASLVAHAS